MSDQFSTAIGDLLAQECTPAVVRKIEQGGDWQDLWRSLQESGFADALVPESDGGAGLTLHDMFGVFERCGSHALPLPFAETILARALLAAAGINAAARPKGPITFATGWRNSSGLRCDLAHSAKTASHVIVQADGGWLLLEVSKAASSGAGFTLDLALEWSEEALDAVPLSFPEPLSCLSVRTLQACVYGALLAGAAGRVFDMTLAYANQRVQFGRVIGKFQAVQHHLAVMSEQVAAARAAAEIGCLSATWTPELLQSAIAKARTSEAALEVARLGHQVHGAIGFTEEFDLQLYTRRLHAWRRAGGAETNWHQVLGDALVSDDSGQTLDLVRSTLRLLPESIS